LPDPSPLKPAVRHSRDATSARKSAAEKVAAPRIDVALDGELLRDVRALIAETRGSVALVVNSALVLLYWHIGARIRREVMADARAEYGATVVVLLAAELSAEFGAGFSSPNLWHMVRFAERYSDQNILYTLCRELSWSHFRALLYIEDELEREFYTEMTRAQRWSVRRLQSEIHGQLFARSALSTRPAELIARDVATLRETGTMSPDLVFLDQVNLSALGLKDLVAEKDLEDAIAAEIEVALRAFGTGFAFIARQFRFRLDGKTFAIDLLFYNRRLRSLVAVDLKLGEFDARDMGQMELYLRYLDEHEKLPDEGRPWGIILCAASAGGNREQIELLRLEDKGIRVAEYLLELPPRAELERRIHEAVERARARVATNTLP
jgi:predicted nuclease of restriction endonuclease-like (RecB) superfamily